MSVLLALLLAVATAAGGFMAGRFLLPAVNDSTKRQVAALEFCALGDDEGASMLDIAGWVTAAQRVNPDWDAVLDEIDKHCMSWRLQVASRANDLGD